MLVVNFELLLALANLQSESTTALRTTLESHAACFTGLTANHDVRHQTDRKSENFAISAP